MPVETALHVSAELGCMLRGTYDALRSQVVVLAHSWGDNVWRTFMRWVTVDNPGWVERHLAAYVNIAGTVLGVSKSTTSLLSGGAPAGGAVWASVVGTAPLRTPTRSAQHVLHDSK